MSDNFELFMRKKALTKRLRERRCPPALQHWSRYAELHKENRHRNEKAYAFLNSNLHSKAFSSLRYYWESKKDLREKHKNACFVHTQSLITKGFYSLVNYKNKSIDLRGKRGNLDRVIRSVYITSLKRTMFKSIKAFNAQTNSDHKDHISTLENKKMQRFFNYLKYYKNKKQDLKTRHKILKNATEGRLKHRCIIEWTRQYDIEQVIKEMQIRRETNTKISWFFACLREVNTNKMCNSFRAQKKLEIKLGCFRALVEHREFEQQEKYKALVADDCYVKGLQQRVLEAFKFNLLIAKSVELLRAKRLIALKTRAFSGFKWNWEVKVTADSFNSIVAHRETKEHFYAWLEATRVRRARKQALEKFLAKKHYYDQLEAFGIWKKDTFFKTMVNLVDHLIIQPEEQNLISDVFYAWRRASEFEQVREQYEQLADANYEVTLTKQSFNAWKVLAAQDMKKYLRLKRGINKITTVMVAAPYYQMIAISEKEKVKETRVFYLLKSKKAQFTGRLFKAWREVVSETKIENLKISHINSHFKANTARSGGTDDDQDSELTFELFKQKQDIPKFKLPVKTQIQITCIKSFQQWTEITPSVLLRKYFSALKYNCKLQKLRREQFEYSATFYCQNMRRKYLRKLVTVYNDRVDEQQNDFKATQYCYERTMVKTWVALIEGVKNSKREAICEAIHQHNLKTRTVMALKENIVINAKKKQLEILMTNFLKNRGKALIKHSYFSWKHHAELENFYKKAVTEFQEYRSMRFKRSVLKALCVESKVGFRLLNTGVIERKTPQRS